MSNLLFLFEDCENIVFRIESEGFLHTCKKYNFCPHRVILLNGLTKEPAVGTLLLVQKTPYYYVVKPCDNTQSLSETFGVDIDDILRYNGVNYLYPYQILQIPK